MVSDATPGERGLKAQADGIDDSLRVTPQEALERLGTHDVSALLMLAATVEEGLPHACLGPPNPLEVGARRACARLLRSVVWAKRPDLRRLGGL